MLKNMYVASTGGDVLAFRNALDLTVARPGSLREKFLYRLGDARAVMHNDEPVGIRARGATLLPLWDNALAVEQGCMTYTGLLVISDAPVKNRWLTEVKGGTLAARVEAFLAEARLGKPVRAIVYGGLPTAAVQIGGDWYDLDAEAAKSLYGENQKMN